MNPLQLSLLDRDWCSVNAPVVLAAMRGREFTADDLHSVLPEPENPNLFGVLVAKLSSAKQIKRIGSKPSERKEANGRWIGIYTLNPQKLTA